MAMKQRPSILPPSARKAFAHRQCHPCTLTCSPIAAQQTMHVNVQALPCPTSLLNRQCVLHVNVQRPSLMSRASLHVNVQNMTGREPLHVNVQGHSERRKGSMHVNVQGPLDTRLKGRSRIQPHQNRADKNLGPGKPPGPKSFWRPEMN